MTRVYVRVICICDVYKACAKVELLSARRARSRVPAIRARSVDRGSRATRVVTRLRCCRRVGLSQHRVRHQTSIRVPAAARKSALQLYIHIYSSVPNAYFRNKVFTHTVK